MENYKEKMHRRIEKYAPFNAKDLIGLYDLIEEVAGRQAEKYYNACRRKGINSARELVHLFVYQDPITIGNLFKGSYCGPKGIAILKECVDWYIDYVPFTN